MGLLGQLFGRGKPRWHENWAVFPGESGEHFAMYCVDLGAVDVAPIIGLPVRVDIEVAFAAREDGMPANGHLPVVQRFEEVVCAEVGGRGGVYVGRVICAGACRYTAYLPHLPAVPLALPRDDFSPTVDLVRDPGWTYVHDVLAPDTEQWHIIRDMQVVRALLEHGDQLDRERPVDYVAYFRDPVSAGEAADELRIDGFAVRVEPTARRGFRLAAVRDDAVEPPRVHKVTWLVREVVERYGGAYDGWGCSIIHG
jgi:hypothetical protein